MLIIVSTYIYFMEIHFYFKSGGITLCSSTIYYNSDIEFTRILKFSRIQLFERLNFNQLCVLGLRIFIHVIYMSKTDDSPSVTNR